MSFAGYSPYTENCQLSHVKMLVLDPKYLHYDARAKNFCHSSQYILQCFQETLH